MPNEPLLFHLNLTSVRSIDPVGPIDRMAQPLPDTLVIPRGAYRACGRTWILEDPGLYRFTHVGCSNHQRIVFEPKDDEKRAGPVTAHVLSLLSGLSWIVSHGSRDNMPRDCKGRKPIKEWLRIALTRKLIVTCGDISDLGREVCRRQGLWARRVSMLTLDERNTYDNSHRLLEVFLGGQWVLIDLDMKYGFSSKNGEPLSLHEFCSRSQDINGYKLQSLASAVPIAVGNFAEGGYDYGLLVESKFSTKQMVRKWYQRVAQVPVVHTCRANAFTARNESDRKDILSSYKREKLVYMPPDEFEEFCRKPPN